MLTTHTRRLTCAVAASLLAACGALEDTQSDLPDSQPEAVISEVTAAQTPDLTAWFSNYNVGQGLSYLGQPHTTNLLGDPRYPSAAPHVHYGEVAYGPFSRNRLDFWQVESDRPTPVAVFIHGGGFQTGSKENVHNGGQTIPNLLAAGVSVASISYRYAYRDPDLAVEAPIPNGEGSEHDVNGTRLDYILRDCARAIQYIRFKGRAWNVNPARIGAWGGSAGAGCATWVGVVDDLAQPNHRDPVLRRSSRLSVIGHTNGQPTYNWLAWPPLLNMSRAFVMDLVEREAVRLTQTSLVDLAQTQQGRDLGMVLDYYRQMGPGDPPFYTENSRPDLGEEDNPSGSDVVHHPRAHVALYDRCVGAGLECEIKTVIVDSGYPGGVTDFVVEHLTN